MILDPGGDRKGAVLHMASENGHLDRLISAMERSASELGSIRQILISQQPASGEAHREIVARVEASRVEMRGLILRIVVPVLLALAGLAGLRVALPAITGANSPVIVASDHP